MSFIVCFAFSCPLQTSLANVHDDPVAEAGEKAKKEFLETHPELKGLKDVELKKLMDKNPRRGGTKLRRARRRRAR